MESSYVLMVISCLFKKENVLIEFVLCLIIIITTIITKMSLIVMLSEIWCVLWIPLSKTV